MSPEEKARAQARSGRFFEVAQAPRQRLSEQQKDWIRESIDRLKAPSMAPDSAATEPD